MKHKIFGFFFVLTFWVSLSLSKATNVNEEMSYENVSKRLNQIISENPEVFNVQDQDAVFLIGKTGAGKSTLGNFLAGYSLVENDIGDLVLQNQNNPKALKIGTGDKSETFIPKAVKIEGSEDLNGIKIFDLPGFGDNRGLATSLINACLIHKSITTARSSRFVFVVGLDEITASRGGLFKELLEGSKSLLPGTKIEDHSCIVINKNSKKDKLINFLNAKLEKGTVDQWINKKCLSSMSNPVDGKPVEKDRKKIASAIKKVNPIKVDKIDIGKVMSLKEQINISNLCDEAMSKILESVFSEKSNFGPKSLNQLKSYKSEIESDFLNLAQERVQKDPLLKLMKPISSLHFEKSFKGFEKLAEEKKSKIVSGIDLRITQIEKEEEAKKAALAKEQARIAEQKWLKEEAARKNAEKIAAAEKERARIERQKRINMENARREEERRNTDTKKFYERRIKELNDLLKDRTKELHSTRVGWVIAGAHQRHHWNKNRWKDHDESCCLDYTDINESISAFGLSGKVSIQDVINLLNCDPFLKNKKNPYFTVLHRYRR